MNPYFTNAQEKHNISVSASNESEAVREHGPDKRFGYMMRLERQAMGLTQSEMGQLLGISTSYVSSIERGKRGATGTLLKKMHDTFKFSYDYMMGSKTAGFPEPAFSVREEAAPYGDVNLNSLFSACSRQDLDVCYRLCRAYLMTKEN